ncbi:MAG: methionine adenosyltransferase [Bacteroidales bacterium]|nr:methionine adenosyltransferase [Bacteroidales bacterium]
MGYLFTSESVSEGHPDKVADQISDAVLDELLRQDPDSKVACETLVTTGLSVVSGEIKTNGYVDVQQVARRVINRIGYTKSDYMFDGDACGVLSSLHEQSPDINQGVVREKAEEQGAGDQGMMFGYACTETSDYMPVSLVLSHMLLQDLAAIRREEKQMTYLRPDSKSQVTIEYGDDNKPSKVHTIVISTQHDPFDQDEKMLKQIKEDVQNILIPRTMKRLSAEVKALFKQDYKLLVNPTGKFVIGGPHGDTGLTGRKIIVDTYGGKGAHGGGAFSGKDASKVDRSAAYASRHMAKNMVAAGICDEVLVQVAYAIGVAEPVSIFVNTYGTAKVKMTDLEIAAIINKVFDMRPAAIINRLKLKLPIYEQTAAYGHFGRDYKKGIETIHYNGASEQIEVEYFTWEKLDYVNKVKNAFGLAQNAEVLVKVESNLKDTMN